MRGEDDGRVGGDLVELTDQRVEQALAPDRRHQQGAAADGVVRVLGRASSRTGQTFIVVSGRHRGWNGPLRGMPLESDRRS